MRFLTFVLLICAYQGGNKIKQSLFRHRNIQSAPYASCSFQPMPLSL